MTAAAEARTIPNTRKILFQAEILRHKVSVANRVPAAVNKASQGDCCFIAIAMNRPRGDSYLKGWMIYAGMKKRPTVTETSMKKTRANAPLLEDWDFRSCDVSMRGSLRNKHCIAR